MIDHMNQQRSNWPHFQLVYFPQTTDSLRELGAPLLTSGMPKSLLKGYQSLAALGLIKIENADLVYFGINSPYTHMCWNPLTGEVVEIVATRLDNLNTLPLSKDSSHKFVVGSHFVALNKVNSTTNHFIAFVQAVYDRFPFDAEEKKDGEDDNDALSADWNRAANDLEAVFKKIESVVMQDVKGFWFNFLSDVRDGAYSTENTLADFQ